MAEGGSTPEKNEIEEIEPQLDQPSFSNSQNNQASQTKYFGATSKAGNTSVIVNQAINVSSGDMTIYNNYSRQRSSRPKSSKPSKPLTESTEQPSTTNLHDISLELGNFWRRLGRCLGFTDGNLEQLYENYPGNAEERNYQMLSGWVKREGEKATKAQLAQCLQESCLGKLADYLADQ